METTESKSRIIIIGDGLLNCFIPLEPKPINLSDEIGNATDNSLIESQVEDLVNVTYPDDCQMVVISSGGNNLLNNVFSLLVSVDHFFDTVLNYNFIRLYEHIITEAKKNNRKVVLSSLYPPYSGTGAMYEKFIPIVTQVMSRWHEFIFALAQKHNVAILDLSKMVDPYNKEHYCPSEIQISSKVTKCIATCINYIYRNYSGYKVFYAPNCDITRIAN